MSNTIKWNETMELNELFVGKSVKNELYRVARELGYEMEG